MPHTIFTPPLVDRIIRKLGWKVCIQHGPIGNGRLIQGWVIQVSVTNKAAEITQPYMRLSH